jgi:hypothetical protein
MQINALPCCGAQFPASKHVRGCELMIALIKKLAGRKGQPANDTFLKTLNNHQQAEAGLHTADIGLFSFGAKDVKARMGAMAEARLGLMPLERWRELDMVQACQHCGNRRACRKWLNGDRDGIMTDSFCPNAGQYAELASNAK